MDESDSKGGGYEQEGGRLRTSRRFLQFPLRLYMVNPLGHHVNGGGRQKKPRPFCLGRHQEGELVVTAVCDGDDQAGGQNDSAHWRLLLPALLCVLVVVECRVERVVVATQDEEAWLPVTRGGAVGTATHLQHSLGGAEGSTSRGSQSEASPCHEAA